MRIVNIRGMEVDVDRIQNPKLRRVVKDRCMEFMFYSDKSYTVHSDESPGHSEHGEYSDYRVYREYRDHAEHREHHEYDDYREHDDYDNRYGD